MSHLPNAVLAAIVFLIGVKLIDIRGLAKINRESRAEFSLALFTAATGVREGIILAVVLSLLAHVRHGYRPHTAVLVRDPDDRWLMVNAEPGKSTEPGLVIFWFGADLYYANANYFAEQTRRLVTGTDVRWLVLDAGAMTAIDCSGGSTVIELQEELAAKGIVLALAHVSSSLRAKLDQHGVSKVVGAGLIFDTLRECLGAFHAQGALPGV